MLLLALLLDQSRLAELGLPPGQAGKQILFVAANNQLLIDFAHSQVPA